MTLITDGLPAYHDAYLKEYWTMKKETRTEHIGHITIRGDHNDNKMERMNGEVRDREKVMRGLKTKETLILAGYQLFHNYIRPHEGLEGKTPAEACGIEVKGKNKWITLIQNSERVAKRYDEKTRMSQTFQKLNLTPKSISEIVCHEYADETLGEHTHDLRTFGRRTRKC